MEFVKNCNFAQTKPSLSVQDFDFTQPTDQVCILHAAHERTCDRHVSRSSFYYIGWWQIGIPCALPVVTQIRPKIFSLPSQEEYLGLQQDRARQAQLLLQSVAEVVAVADHLRVDAALHVAHRRAQTDLVERLQSIIRL